MAITCRTTKRPVWCAAPMLVAVSISMLVLGCGEITSAPVPTAPIAARPSTPTASAETTGPRSFRPPGTQRGKRWLFEADLRLVRPNETVPFEIELRNPTSASWEIKDVGLSCSCLAAQLSKQVVAPGDAVLLKSALRTSSHSEDKLRSITVNLTGGTTEALDVVIRYAARDQLTVTPDEPRLVLDPDDEGEIDLAVFNFGDHDWSAIEVSPTSPRVKLRAEMTALRDRVTGSPRPRQGARVRVLVSPVTEPGEYKAEIAIDAKGPDLQRRVVPVMVVVRDPMTLAPGQLFFGKVTPGESIERSIILRVADSARCPKNPSDFEFASSLGDALSASATLLAEDRCYWRINTRFIVPQDSAGGFQRTTLELSFAANAQRYVRSVPVVYSVE